jgi:hypothetical protein
MAAISLELRPISRGLQFEALNSVPRTHYTKSNFIYHREKADEMTFPEQNHMKTYSRLHIVQNEPTVLG